MANSLPLQTVKGSRRLTVFDLPNSQDSAMALNPPRTWFGPKRIGWGISPHTWEGWLILVIFVIVVITLGATVFS